MEINSTKKKRSWCDSDYLLGKFLKCLVLSKNFISVIFFHDIKKKDIVIIEHIELLLYKEMHFSMVLTF